MRKHIFLLMMQKNQNRSMSCFQQPFFRSCFIYFYCAINMFLKKKKKLNHRCICNGFEFISSFFYYFIFFFFKQNIVTVFLSRSRNGSNCISLLPNIETRKPSYYYLWAYEFKHRYIHNFTLIIMIFGSVCRAYASKLKEFQ